MVLYTAVPEEFVWAGKSFHNFSLIFRSKQMKAVCGNMTSSYIKSEVTESARLALYIWFSFPSWAKCLALG